MREILTKWRTAIISGIASLVLVVAITLAFGSGGNGGADAAAGGDVDSSPQEVTETSGGSADNDEETQSEGSAVDATKAGDTSGSDGATASPSSWEPHAVSETPKNYGTSPANIANGGYVAYANGRTYFIYGEGYKQYYRTAIGVAEDGGTGFMRLYKAQEYKEGLSNRLSCLHIVGNSLFFCECYNASSGAKRYDIIKTNLDGTKREVIKNDLRAARVNDYLQKTDSYMWIDDGYVYYLDRGSLWRMSLDGKNKEFVVEVTESNRTSLCAVNDGIAYYTTSDYNPVIKAIDLDTNEEMAILNTDSSQADSGDSGNAVAIRSITDQFRIGSILPCGDKVYLTVVGSPIVDSALDGWISFNSDGSDATHYSGVYEEDSGFGILSMIPSDDGCVYVIVGSGHVLKEGIAITRVDTKSDGENTKLYQCATIDENGETTAPEGDLIGGKWITLANDRLYFESTNPALSYGADGAFDKSVPWSIDIEGNDLRRGFE